METIPLLHFTGEDAACDECRSLAGYYTKEPPRPHPKTCQCEVVVEFVDGDYDYRKDEPVEVEFEIGGVDFFEFHNPEIIAWFVEETLEVTLTGDASCDPVIEEAFDVPGTYEEEQTFEAEFSQELYAGETVMVEAIGIYKSVNMGVEVWFVSEEEDEEGEKIEVYLYTVTDEIRVPAGLRLEVVGPPEVVEE